MVGYARKEQTDASMDVSVYPEKVCNMGGNDNEFICATDAGLRVLQKISACEGEREAAEHTEMIIRENRRYSPCDTFIAYTHDHLDCDLLCCTN